MDVRLTGAVYIADARLVADGWSSPRTRWPCSWAGRARGGWPCSWSGALTLAPAAGTARPWPCSPQRRRRLAQPERALTLRGSSKIDTFTDEVHGVTVDLDDDHELILLVDGDEVGRVPMAVLDEDLPWSTGSGTGCATRRSRRARWSGSRSRRGAAPATGPCPSAYGTSTAAYVLVGDPSSASPGWPRPTGRC